MEISKSWLSTSIKEVLVCCGPMTFFIILSLGGQDFNVLFSHAVVLICLFVFYIFYKNRQIKIKFDSINESSEENT